jgi:hypothetical protein
MTSRDTGSAPADVTGAIGNTAIAPETMEGHPNRHGEPTVTFDARRAMLKGPDLFRRFVVPDTGTQLAHTCIPKSEQLIVFERTGEKRALLVRQMAYHHVAQGVLADDPFLITF